MAETRLPRRHDGHDGEYFVFFDGRMPSCLWGGGGWMDPRPLEWFVGFACRHACAIGKRAGEWAFVCGGAVFSPHGLLVDDFWNSAFQNRYKLFIPICIVVRDSQANNALIFKMFATCCIHLLSVEGC